MGIRIWSTLNGNVRTPKSVTTICPYCGERVVFTLENHLEDTAKMNVSSRSNCPGCNKIVRFWAIRNEQRPKDEKENPAEIYMYPAANSNYIQPEFSNNIPDALQRAFISTVDAFNSKNYAATAVCARRTLEGIFKYLVKEDKRNEPLAKMIENVKNEIDLSAPLKSLSHAIRDGGNLGAHFDMDKEPNEILARHMVELLEYLISYLYVLPEEIKKLEKILEKNTIETQITI